MDFSSVAEYQGTLIHAIEGAMTHEIERSVQETIQEVMDENVYSYKREELDPYRRKKQGGLQDRANLTPKLTTTYIGDSLEMTLIIEATAPWQTSEDAQKTGIPLGEAVEIGEEMHGAGARPFMEDAEEKYEERFANELKHQLVLRGF